MFAGCELALSLVEVLYYSTILNKANPSVAVLSCTLIVEALGKSILLIVGSYYLKLN